MEERDRLGRLEAIRGELSLLKAWLNYMEALGFISCAKCKITCHCDFCQYWLSCSEFNTS